MVSRKVEAGNIHIGSKELRVKRLFSCSASAATHIAFFCVLQAVEDDATVYTFVA
jgi:hypothetical protein